MLMLKHLKSLLAVVTLASWLVGSILLSVADATIPLQERRFEAALVLAGGYALAILFLALSALIHRRGAEEPMSGPGMKFLLCGPPALAALIAVGATIVGLYRRHFCSIIDCFSLYGLLRFHLPYFISEFTVISWRLHEIIFIAFLIVRLIQMMQKTS
jgi:hypothetical protein